MNLPRIYDTIMAQHVGTLRQMAFLAGPRQAGKTTTARAIAHSYLDWDSPAHQRMIVAGSDKVAEHLGLNALREKPLVLALDEFHKYGPWKNWLKGFFDLYSDRCRVVVTGSSRLDVYRRGGDSLMGRYFLYRMHPLSVAELVRQSVPDSPIRPPKALPDATFEALWEHGGFPEPFSRRNSAFSRRWRDTRRTQLVREDVRDLTRIHELAQLSILVEMLSQRSADTLVFANLAGDVRVAEDTIRRWIDTLASLHFGFLVRPWFRNVTKALRKEPKWFLRDWSGLEDPGKRTETLVACHLLKAVDGWNDLGLGAFELRYVRDKAKREVDFLVVRDRKPWFLAEVKHADDRLSPALAHFQSETGAAHAFQVVMKRPYVGADCFAHRTPIVVPARTFLSQLL